MLKPSLGAASRALLASLVLPAAAAGQQVTVADTLQHLRSGDPKVRLAAVRLLRESPLTEAAEPLAPLVTDPVDGIQLEAIAAALSLFVTPYQPAHRRGAFVVEARDPGSAAAVFEAGPPAVWPRRAPARLLASLLEAADDENARVRAEAMYAFGALARPPLEAGHAAALVQALEHRDPRVRAAAAQVSGRMRLAEAADALIDAINDSSAEVRYAAMRAAGSLGDPRAVQALADQFLFYGKGEGAAAALDALARIAHPSSVALFRERLADKDASIRRAAAEGLGRAGDTGSMSTLELAASADSSAMVRAAIAFALQKLGRNFVARMVEFLGSPAIAGQAEGYLLELGSPVVPSLSAHLRDPSPSIRARVVEVLGVIGDRETIGVIQPLTKDADPGVARLASQAVQRIKGDAQR